MGYREMKGKLIDEVIYSRKLPNGLEVFYMPKKGYTKQYAMFATKFGSNDLTFQHPKTKKVLTVPQGIAHFLEHKMFEEPEGNVFDRFAALGANANAYTNFNITAYYFTSTDNFYESLKNLIQFVQSPYFTEESVEKEKGIIEQEIKMYRDNPQWKVFFNLLKSMYHGHPVRNDIAGTVESIYTITSENLYDCYNTFYHPSNMAVFVVGDLDRERVFHTIEKYFEGKQNSDQGKIERVYFQEPKTIERAFVEEGLSISTPIFNIGYKDIQLGLEGWELLKKEAVTRILLDMIFGKSSPLFQILYEKSLINDVFGAEYVGEVDYGHSLISGESKNPKEVMRIINEYISKLQKEGLSKADFRRIQKKHMGEHLSYFNSIEFIGSSFINYYFKNINLLEYIEAIQALTFEEAQKRFDTHLTQELQVMSVIQSS